VPTSLVTGGAGFIGSHVIDELVTMGHQVVALDDLSGGFKDHVNPQAAFWEGSVTDRRVVRRLFREYAFDYVFHLAAYAAEGLSHFIKRFNYVNNLIGSVELTNAAVNAGSVKCFVFTSSIAVYGRQPPPMTEDMPPCPEDPYGIAKFAVELDLREAHGMFGLNHVIFRPHNVYGERQNIGDPYRNVIGIFMNQILQGQPLTVFGDGRQTRAFSYIADVAPVIARAVEVPAAYNQVFNIGAETPCCVLELARMICQVMGVPANIRHLAAREEVAHAFSAHDKVRRYFGSLIRDVDLETGLRSMAEWARRTGARQGRPFRGIEVWQALPPSWMEFTRQRRRKRP